MKHLPMPPKKLEYYEVLPGLMIHTDSLGFPIFAQKKDDIKTQKVTDDPMIVDVTEQERKALNQFIGTPFYLGVFEKVKGSQVWRAVIIWPTKGDELSIKQRIAGAYTKMALADLSSPKTTLQAKDPLVCAVEVLHHQFETETPKPRKRR